MVTSLIPYTPTFLDPAVFSSGRVLLYEDNMLTDYKHFYCTNAWVKCRESYKKYRGGLCERCYAKGLIVPGKVVHHKIYLNAETVNDPSITLNFDNLELLCAKCHEQEHDRINGGARTAKRYFVDEFGKVIISPRSDEN